MVDGTRCRVIHDDGTPCTRLTHNALSICQPCYKWSWRRGGTDPNGRPPARGQKGEADFLAALTAANASLLEERYLGYKVPHRVRCIEGHLSRPTPGRVQQGKNICSSCGGKPTAEQAWLDFQNIVHQAGGVVLEVNWLGSQKPHLIVCRKGHEVLVRPAHVAYGTKRRKRGICVTCAGRDPKAAEAHFDRALADRGAKRIEPEWLGSQTPHRVICVKGHDCMVWPAVLRSGQNICMKCSGRDPEVLADTFFARLDDLGVKLHERRYLGAITPHPAICRKGHACAPRPSDISRGRGACGACKGRIWDAIYVVHDPTRGIVKPGITSGDPRPRLSDHERAGFNRLVCVYTGLADRAAFELERKILVTLDAAGIKPVQGFEYFPDDALPIILDLIRNHSHI
ncbi:hypothetical protein [Streptomyces zaomyceticus]|uniref:hypothetical protein n=1 Tax=Streptomyces zaomyceticus TaxID=68286 RepID=UPI0037BCD50A